MNRVGFHVDSVVSVVYQWQNQFMYPTYVEMGQKWVDQWAYEIGHFEYETIHGWGFITWLLSPIHITILSFWLFWASLLGYIVLLHHK